MIDTASPRAVPGAPASSSLSKSQLKKMRKAMAKTDESVPETPVEIPDPTASALIEKAPVPSDIQEGSVAPELVAQQSSQEQDTSKASPLVELINKRLKASNKKITRISSYATADHDTLNDDQKRSLKTLPTLEAIVKELSEVKKIIEVYEVEHAKDLLQKHQEIEALERKKISQTVAQAQSAHINLTSDILLFIRVRNEICAGDRDPFSYGLSQREVEVINAVGAVLLGNDTESKCAVIQGFFSIEGSFEEISYERLLDIARQVIASRPRPPSPAHVAPEESSIVASEVSVANDAPVSKSSGLHFLQESEIETTSFDQNTEGVEHPIPSEQQPENADQQNGHADAEAAAPPGEPIDWAAEGEDDLPSIDGLHATFGKSGTVTPDVQAEPMSQPPASEPNGLPGSETVLPADEDGFTQARGGRARDRAFRGGERGAFRDSRGSDRGGFRGGRGYRGSFRGGRGRGDWRGDSEYRGRGGRGRRGDRGGASHTPPAAP
ncbi:hypothetical protein E1B28_010131 [Marasmius oreades]|uniref:Uncharacterized protein n=1 Tax=Marasmius oreades TaxID=181124 RepID=A0A9P7RWG9_9AGAR|nr:uncharacterized protein E1B28_010131 [Marasmius oreades]KAG7091074.1 hypothetical protein E1B28_010131 [Marasmius oreades]